MVIKKHPVDTAIRKSLSGIKSDPRGSCPDDNIVAAYLEGVLSSPEKSHFEEHASSCLNCQELVALSTKLLDPESDQLSPAKTLPHRGQRGLFRFPITALALLLVTVAIGIIFREERSKQREAENTPTLSASSAPKDQVTSTEAPKLDQAPPPRAAGEQAARGKAKERSDKSGLRDSEKPAAVPPVSEPKSAVLRDGPDDFRTREKRSETLAGLKKNEGFAVPTARTGGLEMQTLPVGQAGGEVSLRNAIAGLSQQRRQQEGDSNKAAQSADRVAIVGGNVQRVIGKRVFQLASGYWIDTQCAEHPGSDIVEINAESPEYVDIRRESPEIEELRTSGVPIMVYSKSKIYVIHQ